MEIPESSCSGYFCATSHRDAAWTLKMPQTGVPPSGDGGILHLHCSQPALAAGRPPQAPCVRLLSLVDKGWGSEPVHPDTYRRIATTLMVHVPPCPIPLARRLREAGAAETSDRPLSVNRSAPYTSCGNKTLLLHCLMISSRYLIKNM